MDAFNMYEEYTHEEMERINRDNERKEWHNKIFKSCNQKRYSDDSSAYCVYCNRKNMVSCNFEFCPKVKELE